EDHVRLARSGLYQLHRLPQAAIGKEQLLPLPGRRPVVNLVLDLHPGVDLVLDPVEVGTAHQDRHIRNLAEPGRSRLAGTPASYKTILPPGGQRITAADVTGASAA